MFHPLKRPERQKHLHKKARSNAGGEVYQPNEDQPHLQVVVSRQPSQKQSQHEENKNSQTSNNMDRLSAVAQPPCPSRARRMWRCHNGLHRFLVHRGNQSGAGGQNLGPCQHQSLVLKNTKAACFRTHKTSRSSAK